jgi:hypothetical protein
MFLRTSISCRATQILVSCMVASSIIWIFCGLTSKWHLNVPPMLPFGSADTAWVPRNTLRNSTISTTKVTSCRSIHDGTNSSRSLHAISSLALEVNGDSRLRNSNSGYLVALSLSLTIHHVTAPFGYDAWSLAESRYTPTMCLSVSGYSSNSIYVDRCYGTSRLSRLPSVTFQFLNQEVYCRCIQPP